MPRTGTEKTNNRIELIPLNTNLKETGLELTVYLKNKKDAEALKKVLDEYFKIKKMFKLEEPDYFG